MHCYAKIPWTPATLSRTWLRRPALRCHASVGCWDLNFPMLRTLMKKIQGLACLCALSFIMGACGGGRSSAGTGGNGGTGGTGGGSNPTITVSVAPSTATVALNGTQQFSATVSPSTVQQ